jgi:hypothetical protein
MARMIIMLVKIRLGCRLELRFAFGIAEKIVGSVVAVTVLGGVGFNGHPANGIFDFHDGSDVFRAI